MIQPPHVTAFAVQTRDGYIARCPRQSTVEWRSAIDAKFFTDRLNSLGENGVIIVGHATYQTAEGPLSKRNCIVFTRSVQSVERRHEKLLLYNPAAMPLAAVLEGYAVVALLGGAEIYRYFFERDLIDELWLTTEPVQFGSGLKFFASHGGLKERFHLESIQSWSGGGTTLSHYSQRLTRARL